MTTTVQARGGPIDGQGAIDVHAHFLPAVYRDRLAAAGLETLDGGMRIPDWSREAALDLMDRNGVRTSILSVSSPGVTFVPAAEEAALARAVNRAAAELVRSGGGRFGAFATLPVGDPAAAIAEIGYALDELGLDGFIIETNHHGAYPGGSAMAPILAELDAREARVLLHPTSPACAAGLCGGRPAPMIEFPFETTRAVVDLIFSGALLHYPRIRFILAHAGGVLPFLAPRIAGFTMAAPATANGLTPSDVMLHLQSLYYDTALSATPVQIAALLALVPASQVMFGSDWPFSPAPVLETSLAVLRSMDRISPNDRDAILFGNARRLLPGIQRRAAHAAV